MAFDHTHIWITNHRDDTVSKIDAVSGRVVDTVAIGGWGCGVAFDGTHIWATNLRDDTLLKIQAD